jgi:uncharacterized protein YjbI with pentapeptide repeats
MRRPILAVGLVSLLVAALLVVGLIVWAAFVQPSWLLDTSGLAGSDLARARNDFRGTMLTALGGLAVVVGVVVGGFTLVHNRQVFEEAREYNRRAFEEAQHQNRAVMKLQHRSHDTERFSKAIEQLGDPDKLMVRVGAIYALEQIAQNSRELHWPIMQVLTACLREHARRPPLAEQGSEASAGQLTTPADIQAIATVIGRRKDEHDPPDQRLDLRTMDLRLVQWPHHSYLKNAILVGARLEGASLIAAQLQKANLEGARLTRAILGVAQLQEAILDGAQLEGADLDGADLDRAYLRGTQLQRAKLNGARLNEAYLGGAQMQGAQMQGAQMQGAELRRTRLGGARMQRAQLNGAQLQGARLDEAQLDGAILSDANLRDTDLRKANGLTWWQVREAFNVDLGMLPSDVRDEAKRDASGTC